MPQDREFNSSENNGFDNLEEHVDADLSEIMLKENDQEDDLMFGDSQKTPTR